MEAGNAAGATAAQLNAAVSDRTAAVLYPAHLESKPGSLKLAAVAEIAHRRSVPLLVDAAYLNTPPEIMRSFSRAGADLVCFSAKYHLGPNSGGFICGRRELIDAVAGLDFTRYESGKYLTFGRPFKLDRHIIVATVVALEEWFAMDHAARWHGFAEKIGVIVRTLAGVRGVTATPRYFTMDERLEAAPVNCAAINFDPGSAHTAASVCDALISGEPSIATVALGSTLVIAADTLLDGEEDQIAKRLKELLA